MNSVTTRGGITLEYDGKSPANNNFCKLCGEKGKRVLRETLANHLRPVYWTDIEEKGFFFCPNRDCPVYYFNPGKQLYYSKDEVQSTVMHKLPLRTKNRPAYYCKNVLEQTIIDELLIKKCCDSLIDIQNFTEANTGKSCKITNPTGRCCGKQIKEIIDWAKEHRDDIDAPLLEEAEACCVKIEENVEDFD